MLEIGNISGLQKSTMALSKLENRQHKLWAVACLFLAVRYSNRACISVAEQTLFPKLAAGLIKSLEPLRSAQEGYLKALVLQINQDPNDTKNMSLLEFLCSKQVVEWDLLELNIMYVEVLDKHGDWKELQTQCIRILKELCRDDFNHWKAFIKASIKLDQIGFANTFIREYKKGQNSMLAMVLLAASVDLENLTLNQALEQYFDYMGSKRSAFNDLQIYFSEKKFDKQKWLEYLESIVPDPKNQNLLANIEKFKFYLRGEKYDLDQFVTQQVAFYKSFRNVLKKKDLKDYHSADDHILLASYAVLEQGNGDNKSLLKAAVLLETACARDQYQFYVRLWLVRIYLLLGAMSKAFAHFSVLRVQRLQVESMSHYIITRCATLFPIDDGPLKPSVATYSTFQREYMAGILSVFDRGTYTQLESFINLENSIKTSLSRGILHVQTKQLSEIQPDKTNQDKSFWPLETAKFSDNRDFDIMFDIPRPGQPKLSQILTLGPKVGERWIRIHEMKHGIVKHLVNGGPKLAALIESLSDLLKEETNSSEQQLTNEETWSCRVVLMLAKSAQCKSSAQGYQSIYQVFESLASDSDTNLSLLNKRSRGSTLRNWKTLHQSFFLLSTWKTIAGYVQILKSKREKIQYNHLSAEKIVSDLYGIVKQAKVQAEQVLGSREVEQQNQIVQLEEWCKKNGLAYQIVKNVVKDVYNSQDLALSSFTSKI